MDVHRQIGSGALNKKGQVSHCSSHVNKGKEFTPAICSQNFTELGKKGKLY